MSDKESWIYFTAVCHCLWQNYRSYPKWVSGDVTIWFYSGGTKMNRKWESRNYVILWTIVFFVSSHQHHCPRLPVLWQHPECPHHNSYTIRHLEEQWSSIFTPSFLASLPNDSTKHMLHFSHIQLASSEH